MYPLHPLLKGGETSPKDTLTNREVTLLTLLEGLTLELQSKPHPYSMFPLCPQPTYPQDQGIISFLQEHNQEEKDTGMTPMNSTQVSSPISPFPVEGIELLERIHSLRLMCPKHSESLSISKVLDLEKTFRGYSYPWLTTLLMRDLALAYNPSMRNRKDLPYMVMSILPCTSAILYPETWDFIMQVLMQPLVGYL